MNEILRIEMTGKRGSSIYQREKYVYVPKTNYGDAPWENNILEIAEKLRPPPCPEVPGRGGAHGDCSRRGNRGNRGPGTGKCRGQNGEVP